MLVESKVEPPHPIPYPSNAIIRKLYRTPILLYRLGLGKLFGKYIMIISTFGRKSGKVRRTPIEYFRQGDFIYAISGFERDPDCTKPESPPLCHPANRSGYACHVRPAS